MAGRPPDAGESRTEYLRVRLAEFEIELVDLARASLSRSDYVRQLIHRDFEDKGLYEGSPDAGLVGL
jgi:hypothetical protein